MVPVVSFVGVRGPNSVEFLKRLVSLLEERGYKIGMLRSANFEFFPELENFNLEAVGIVNPNGFCLQRRDGFDIKYQIFLNFDDCDLVICENIDECDAPKFVFLDENLEVLDEDKGILGIISPTEEAKGSYKTFSMENPEEMASFIEDFFIRKREDGFLDEVELFINGRRVPMKFYVRETLREILFGFIKPLKGIEYPIEKLEVRVVLNRGGKRS